MDVTPAAASSTSRSARRAAGTATRSASVSTETRAARPGRSQPRLDPGVERHEEDRERQRPGERAEKGRRQKDAYDNTCNRDRRQDEHADTASRQPIAPARPGALAGWFVHREDTIAIPLLTSPTGIPATPTAKGTDAGRPRSRQTLRALLIAERAASSALIEGNHPAELSVQGNPPCYCRSRSTSLEHLALLPPRQGESPTSSR